MFLQIFFFFIWIKETTQCVRTFTTVRSLMIFWLQNQMDVYHVVQYLHGPQITKWDTQRQENR